jgi:hypothetical protein
MRACPTDGTPAARSAARRRHAGGTFDGTIGGTPDRGHEGHGHDESPLSRNLRGFGGKFSATAVQQLAIASLGSASAPGRTSTQGQPPDLARRSAVPRPFAAEILRGWRIIDATGALR